MQDFQSALHYISKAIDIIEKLFGKDYGDLNYYIQFKTQIESHIENKAKRISAEGPHESHRQRAIRFLMVIFGFRHSQYEQMVRK